MRDTTRDVKCLRVHAAHFEGLFASDPDPWGYERLWTEEAKRRAVRGLIGGRPVGRLLEIGCGSGSSSAALARWALRLDAIDGSANAVARARRRTDLGARVRIDRARLPGGLPKGPYDAVVAVEMLYYLPRPTLRMTLREIGTVLRSKGRIIVGASLRPFGDRDISHLGLFEELEGAFGRPLREVGGGAWRLAAYEVATRQH